MKLISANKLNRLWNNGVVAKMVAKTKILKTLEEIEANTNEENVAGATALKEVNNKLAQGRVELVVNNDGTLGYKLDGADTVYPFIKCKKISVSISGSMDVLHPSSYSGLTQPFNGNLEIDIVNKTYRLTANNPDVSRNNLKISNIKINTGVVFS